MIFFKTVLRLVLIPALLLTPTALLADTNCDEGTGPLNPAQPQGMTPQEIIQKFAAREEVFRQARNNYVYTQDITVQELDGTTVTGEFRLDLRAAEFIASTDPEPRRLRGLSQQDGLHHDHRRRAAI